MLKMGVSVLGLVIAFGGTSARAGTEVTLAKAAELTLHRVERLVILKRIDASFQSKLERVQITRIPAENDDVPAFRAYVEQLAGKEKEGIRKGLEILLNRQGKAISHAVTDGLEAAETPVWANKDSVTLSENSLHFVLEKGGDDPKLAPWLNDLNSFAMHQEQGADGVKRAVVEMRTLSGTSVLRVRILDNGEGSFESSEILDPEAVQPTYSSIKRLVFELSCLRCHSKGGHADDVVLLDWKGLLSSPRDLVIPKKSDESGLVIALSRGDQKRMPPAREGAALSPHIIQTIRSWIDQGAPEN